MSSVQVFFNQSAYLPTALTTSNNIADVFGKQHYNVLRAIDNLAKDLPAEWHALNFECMQTDVEIGNGATRKDRSYQITRDGFVMLVMGFTGKKAAEFKLAYIEAFNAMEKKLIELSSFEPDSDMDDLIPASLEDHITLTVGIDRVVELANDCGVPLTQQDLESLISLKLGVGTSINELSVHQVKLAKYLVGYEMEGYLKRLPSKPTAPNLLEGLGEEQVRFVIQVIKDLHKLNYEDAVEHLDSLLKA
jgi:Rha family phage regulatory protein